MANSFKNKKVDLTTTDLTTLYTVPTATTTVIKSLLVTEDAGSGSTITITLVNSSGAIFNLFKDKAIASKASTEQAGTGFDDVSESGTFMDGGIVDLVDIYD